jgi:stage IV sporulation protein A
VRTGKSTFIKRFMESLVLPTWATPTRATGRGTKCRSPRREKTVMTTEPKFVPDEAVSITLDDAATLRVKMIDCVGYIVNDGTGYN